jgi:hypothetical protein
MLPLRAAIQRHVAIVAISASTVRGQGIGGVVAAARSFLAVLPLQPFGASSEGSFRKALDEATSNLLNSLPKPAQSWGLARKCMNIFLRDSFYNSHLAKAHQLAAAAPSYEVPLDGVVARALWKLAPRNQLPTWLGVKHLLPAVSEIYQSFALDLSHKWKIDGVYLDTYLWVDWRETSGA